MLLTILHIGWRFICLAVAVLTAIFVLWYATYHDGLQMLIWKVLWYCDVTGPSSCLEYHLLEFDKLSMEFEACLAFVLVVLQVSYYS